MRKYIVITLLLISTAALGWIDVLLGGHVATPVLYAIPIAIAAWLLGRWWAWFFAIAVIIPNVYVQSAQVGLRLHSWDTAVWILVFRLVAYLLIAEIIARLVATQQELVKATEEVRKSYEQLDSDLQSAKELQEAVLENPLPNIPDIDIAAETVYAQPIGGDFWEVTAIAGSLHLVIGDVSGKSIQAALFTTLLKHLIGEARDISLQPGDILSYVNAQLERRLPPEMFVTLFYGRYDLDTHALMYANAGHNPPLVYKRRTCTVTELSVTTMVAGLMKESPGGSSSESAFMDAGDILILYSDGIVEGKLQSGGRLGTDLLRHTIHEIRDAPAREIVDHLISDAQRLTMRDNRDDMTLVCMKLPP